jgi:hypothetical protein
MLAEAATGHPGIALTLVYGSEINYNIRNMSMDK